MPDGVNPDTGNSDLSVREGASELAGILNPSLQKDKNEAAGPERDAGEPDEANDAAAPDHVSDDEANPDHDEDTDETDDTYDMEDGEDGEDSDVDTEESEDAASDDDDDQEPTVRLKDGTEVTLGEVEEWRQGNMRDADYRRKTMELSATRKELDSRNAEAAQKLQHLDQNLNFAIELAKAYVPQPPDPSLAQSDPLGYTQQKAAYEAEVGQLQQLMAAKQQVDQTRQNESSQSQQRFMQAEAERLLEKMPELKDKAKLDAFNADLVKGLEDYGISKQDLNQANDHRLILVAKDAIAYRKLMASKDKAKAKVKDAPPVQKPGRRASSTSTKGRVKKEKQERLRKSGSLKDGAAVIADMINRN